jgi:hypothetical protein
MDLRMLDDTTLGESSDVAIDSTRPDHDWDADCETETDTDEDPDSDSMCVMGEPAVCLGKSPDLPYDQLSCWLPQGRGIYKPLEESTSTIRLLCLEPGSFGTPLHGRLFHLYTHAGIRRYPYECISYAWGEPVFSGEIHIIGCGMLQITPSLQSALQHLRYQTGQRWLWADAICIDQKDLKERSAQVAIMFEIFRLASRVLVWLGPGEATDIFAFTAIHSSADEHYEPSVFGPLLNSRVTSTIHDASAAWSKLPRVITAT